MSARPTCPSHDTLQRLLAGNPTDPPAPDLFGHIEQCPDCVRTLFDLGRGDTLPELIRAGARHDTAADARDVEPLIRRLLEHPPDAESTVAPAGGSAGADAAAAALSPPRQACELGRLGPYRVLTLLGRGGMGAVYQAEDPRLGRMVALKVMLPHVAGEPGMAERFLREARVAAALEHDHVVPIYEVSEANGVPYIAMPLLKGETLAGRLADAPGPQPVADVVAVGRQVAAGLAAAHAAGLVHRDVKPANLWLDATAGGRVRILDFGLARGDADHQLTRTGAILGTPAYMAPEQARGEPVDGRADLFSLGVVLYRMATGALPFEGPSTLAVLAALATHAPTPVRDLNPRVPEPLAGLIQRLLAKSPADRPASAAAVVAELSAGAAPARPVHPTRRGGWAVATAAAAALLAGVGYGLNTLVFETKTGTLVVEVDADADVRFRNGALNIHDENGVLRYTLTPGERNTNLPSGRYVVAVVGADGLTVDTDRFELGKGGRTIRVRAEPPRGPAAGPPAAGPRDLLAESAFAGKVVFRDTFASAAACRLPLAEGPPVRRAVRDGRYEVDAADLKAGGVVLTEVGPGVAVGAFAGRVLTEGGPLVVNFRSRNDGRRADWLGLRVAPTGEWSVVARRDDFAGEAWVPRPPTGLTAAAAADPALVSGKWVDLAARWSETDYEVWLNGRRVAGGPLDPKLFAAGPPQPVQVVAQSLRGGPAKLSLQAVTVWDQTPKAGR